MRKVTFIISTIGRSKKLNELCSYLKKQFREDEIILIDNSKDGVLNNKFKKDKYIKYFHESNIGLSNARNRGAKESSNDILLFLDDDIIPTASFKEIIENYKNRNSINGVVGGRIIVEKIPDYLPKKYHYIVGKKDFGKYAKKLSKKENLGGCCLMVDKMIFDMIGGFDSAYGHKNTEVGANEDVLFQRQIRKLGLDIIYEPYFEVNHFWEGNQEMVSNRLRVQGINDSILDKENNYLEFILKNIKYSLYIILKRKSEDLTTVYDIVRYKAYVQNRGRKKIK